MNIRVLGKVEAYERESEAKKIESTVEGISPAEAKKVAKRTLGKYEVDWEAIGKAQATGYKPKFSVAYEKNWSWLFGHSKEFMDQVRLEIADKLVEKELKLSKKESTATGEEKRSLRNRYVEQLKSENLSNLLSISKKKYVQAPPKEAETTLPPSMEGETDKRLIDLPKEIWESEIVSKLAVHELASFARSSKATHSAFEKRVRTIECGGLEVAAIVEALKDAGKKNQLIEISVILGDPNTEVLEPLLKALEENPELCKNITKLDFGGYVFDTQEKASKIANFLQKVPNLRSLGLYQIASGVKLDLSQCAFLRLRNLYVDTINANGTVIFPKELDNLEALKINRIWDKANIDLSQCTCTSLENIDFFAIEGVVILPAKLDAVKELTLHWVYNQAVLDLSQYSFKNLVSVMVRGLEENKYVLPRLPEKLDHVEILRIGEIGTNEKASEVATFLQKFPRLQNFRLGELSTGVVLDLTQCNFRNVMKLYFQKIEGLISLPNELDNLEQISGSVVGDRGCIDLRECSFKNSIDFAVQRISGGTVRFPL